MGKEDHIEYIKAIVYTTIEGAEALASVFSSLGIAGWAVEDPADLDFIIASKDVLAWDYVDIQPFSGSAGSGSGSGEVRVSVWLPKEEEAKLQELRIALMKLKSDELYGAYGDRADFGRLWLDTEAVKDDWKDKYKESFHAFSPCEGILVVPPWERAEYAEYAEYAEIENGGKSADGLLKIVIDPGMAFGTGSHETTAMCLSRLVGLIKPGDTVLDAGTGSGILAIAAAKLGASFALAAEIDVDAAASALRNIEANGVQEAVKLYIGDVAAEGALPPDERFDLITANLSCSLIERLLPMFKMVLKDNGAIILSGLLDTQEGIALNALENAGLRIAETTVAGEWLMMEVRK